VQVLCTLFFIFSFLLPTKILHLLERAKEVLAVRIITCFLGGIVAGLILRFIYKGKSFFNFEGFQERKSRDTDPNLLLRLLKNIGRNFKATGKYFLIGVLLSALFHFSVEGYSVWNVICLLGQLITEKA